MDFSSFGLCYKGLAKYLGSHVLMDFATPPTPTKASWAEKPPKASAWQALSIGVSEASTEVDTSATLPDFRLVSETDSNSDNGSCQLGLEEGSPARAWAARELRRSAALGAAVRRRMQEASALPDWRRAQFQRVKTLQSAPRNQGSVELMRSLERGGAFVAVKVMPNNWVTGNHTEFGRQYPNSTERPWFDIGITRYLHDQGFTYVCEPYGIFRDRQSTYVVSSLATQGDLFSWLERDPLPGAERERMMRPIMQQVLCAVRQLHDLGVAHRDLSLENILVTEEGRGPSVKLIDFGMAGVSRRCRGSGGKRSYVAPELYGGGDHDAFLCDAFAVGVVVFTLAARSYPWDSTRPGACKRFKYIATHGFRTYLYRRKVARTSDDRLAQVFSGPFVDLLESLLSLRPEDRCGLGERCWREEGDFERPSVWDMPWVNSQD